MLDHQAVRRLRQGAHAACALALACAATASAQSADTTTQGGDGAHRNAWAQTGVRPPLEEAWRVPAVPVGTPLVSGGHVVVQTANAVAAFDAATGAAQWSVPLSGGPADLAADGTRVYLALKAGVVALNLAGGGVAWSAPGEAATGAVVGGDRVLVGTASGSVAAYDTATGAPRWVTPVFMGAARPAVAGDRAYVVGGCRAVALSVSTGLPLWASGACLGDTGARTVLAGGLVWGEDGAIYAAADGARLSPGPAPGTAGAGVLFGNPLPRPPAALVAADASTFAPRWTWTPSLPGTVRLRPAVVDGVVFAPVDAGGTDAYLAAVDPATGRETWSGFLGDAAGQNSALAAGPGLLVVPTASGVVALRNAPAGPLGVVATVPSNVVVAGTSTVVTGQIESAGHGLVGPRAVALQADPYPFDGDYVPAGFTVAGRSGFSFTVPVARNTHLRLAADGVFYPPTTVYAQPSLQVGYARTSRRRVVRATLRIAAAKGLRRRHGRVAVYRVRSGGRVARRLGAGRSTARGIARFSVRIPASLKRSDRVFPCLRRASRQGFGPANAVDRRCGARRIRLPTAATAAANRASAVPFSGTSGARLLRSGT